MMRGGDVMVGEHLGGACVSSLCKRRRRPNGGSSGVASVGNAGGIFFLWPGAGVCSLALVGFQEV